MLLRADDLFVDEDAEACNRIWELGDRYGFRQILCCVPRGRGAPLWHSKPSKQGNRWILKATGSDHLDDNRELRYAIEARLQKGDILALHGYYHISYRRESPAFQENHLKQGRNYLREVFGVKPRMFVPPFNGYNKDTVDIANRLGMTVIVPLVEEVDVYVTNPKHTEEDIQRLARTHVKMMHPHVPYHPYWLRGGWGESRVYVPRRERSWRISAATWTLDWALERFEIYLKALAEAL